MEIGLVIAGAVVFLIGLVVGAGAIIYCVKQYLKMNGYIIENMRIKQPLTAEESRRLFAPLQHKKHTVRNHISND